MTLSYLILGFQSNGVNLPNVVGFRGGKVFISILDKIARTIVSEVWDCMIEKGYCPDREINENCVNRSMEYELIAHAKSTSTPDVHFTNQCMCSLYNKVLAWVWIGHCAHFRHDYSVCSHVCFKGVTLEKSAPVGHFSCKYKLCVKLFS